MAEPKTTTEGGKKEAVEEKPEKEVIPKEEMEKFKAFLKTLSDEELKEMLAELGLIEQLHKQAQFAKDPRVAARAKFELKRELKKVDEEIKILDERIKIAEGLKGKTEEEKKKVYEGYEAEAKEAKEEARRQKERARSLRAPEFYYAKMERREMESKEMKLLATDNYEELVEMFLTSLKDKNKPRCGAIMRKLANDYNDNEIFNFFGYPRAEHRSGAEGMHAFFNEVMIGRKLDDKEPYIYNEETGEWEENWVKIDYVPGTDIRPLGMETEEALSLENDVSYINEQRNHWDTARCVGMRLGRHYQLPEDMHVLICLAELRKSPGRAILAQMNRLGYGYEVVDRSFDFTSDRHFRMAPLGMALLLELSPGWQKLQSRTFSEHMNPNVRAHIFDLRNMLRKAGVNPGFLNTLEGVVGDIEKAPTLDETTKRAFSVPLVPEEVFEKELIPKDVRRAVEEINQQMAP